MLTYNTKLKKLVIPEYGRNIHRMVDHCLTIENREERNKCAASIVKSMETLFPPEGNQEEYHRKLWDHLAIMSDFKLDIDWPYEIIPQESLNPSPTKLEYAPYNMAFRQYGKHLEQMIQVAAKMQDSPERRTLVLLLANQMKKSMLAVNPDGIDDDKIFKDLRTLSHGEFNLKADGVVLFDYKAMPAPSKKKKKK